VWWCRARVAPAHKTDKPSKQTAGESILLTEMPFGSKSSTHILALTLMLQSMFVELAFTTEVLRPKETPELDEILYLVNDSEISQGVLLHTREYEEDA
jgi:hypothetical protein